MKVEKLGGEPAGKTGNQKLKETVQQFEAILIKRMLSQMRASARALSSGETSGDRRIYEDWQDEMMAKEMSKGGGIGLAEVLYRQLKPVSGEDHKS